MSNIFDALNKGRGEISELLLPLIEAEQLAATQNGQTSPSNGQPIAPPVPAAGEIAAPRPAALAPAPPTPAPAVTAGLADLWLNGVRTLPVRIASPSPILPFDGHSWQASEQYRILRTKISQDPAQRRTIVISSAGPGDGKSITAINIAGALGLKNESKVVLIDADLRKSSIHLQLGLPEGPGLAEVLKASCTLEEALVRVEQFPNLHVLPAGSAKGNPVELLDGGNWKELSRNLRKIFRYVVFDSPPIAAVADFDLIQAVCDGVVIVARPDHTNRRLCLKAVESVPKEKMMGVLLNCVSKWFLGKYTSPDYYYQSDSTGAHKSL